MKKSAQTANIRIRGYVSTARLWDALFPKISTITVGTLAVIRIAGQSASRSTSDAIHGWIAGVTRF